MKKLLFLFPALILALLVWAAPNPDDVVGVWKDGSGRGHIQIYKANGKYYGKLIWSTNDKDGKPRVDRNNPDPSLRARPLVGLVVLRHFSFDKDDEEWTGGRIYNPQDGKDYKAYIKLKDKNTLSIRGYVGITWIGKTDTWTRVR
ncbi:MAG TPA: DUF2147 domain-containing protein [Chitinophagaceae bacterium]|jgi:uncharacterized protein (DUF2147 family)|nr:DUF2147 domain-containing protein [Chitinophagaceae bacterium]